jgi:hypothetical protein
VGHSVCSVHTARAALSQTEAEDGPYALSTVLFDSQGHPLRRKVDRACLLAEPLPVNFRNFHFVYP